MTPSTLFPWLNTLALLAWIPLIVRPRHPRVLRWAGQAVPLLLAIVYAILIALRIGRTEGDFNSLAGVTALFRDPWILLAGWVHYLAFDLLIGVWEARDATARNLPQLALVPCLLLTFLFGPAGWLLYRVVRSLVSPRRNPAALEATP